MRRGWILLLLLAALALPVSAVDVLAQERQILQVDSLTDPLSGQTREALEDYSPASQTDPASAILDIFKWASNLSVGTLREAVQTGAMLLTAAKMLKENEDALCGTVKLMFQPAEETFEGARDMLENELLENPPVDAALAYHVAAGKSPVGFVMYNDSGVMMASVDGFEITVHGRGSHGANPNLAIDPINVGVHIHLALQELIARESDPTKTCVLTIGQFMAGTAANIIPDTAVLRGTIRTNDKKARALLVRRMRETAERTAAVYNATVEIRTLSEVCPLVCDKSVTDDMLRYMGALNIPNFTPYGGISATGSEDFALVAERVPSAMMYLGAGYMDERGQYTAHNPKVVFNEGVLPIGAACMAHCAVEWLKENA